MFIIYPCICSSLRAATTKYTHTGGLKNRNLFSHSSEDWRVNIKMLVDLVSPGVCVLTDGLSSMFMLNVSLFIRTPVKLD